MPRPNPPPTPGSSSDIRPKEASATTPAFNLPPTAFQETDRLSTNSSTPSANGSDSSYRPISPTASPNMSRKRPATHPSLAVTRDDFSLPPPPTRSRKIIQMQPRSSQQQDPSAPSATTSPPTVAKAQNGGSAGGKKKQSNPGTTAAGRKIARKTAHSLIERRRRSKMNEEFGVLKDMIPACKGQEMHKLAILQASIDYLRYLEQCVSDLQAQNSSPPLPRPASTSQDAHEHAYNDEEEEGDNEDDEDEEMEDENEDDASTSTPATTALEPSSSVVSLPSLSQITSSTAASPSVFSAGAGRHYSISSASQASYSPYFHSNQLSPAFGPQLAHLSATTAHFTNAFGLGSPALKPIDSVNTLRQIAEGATELSEKPRPAARPGRSEHELDQEATAALLMLNHDRRNWRAAHDHEASRSSTGMSVRDLLSG